MRNMIEMFLIRFLVSLLISLVATECFASQSTLVVGKQLIYDGKTKMTVQEMTDALIGGQTWLIVDSIKPSPIVNNGQVIFGKDTLKFFKEHILCDFGNSNGATQNKKCDIDVKESKRQNDSRQNDQKAKDAGVLLLNVDGKILGIVFYNAKCIGIDATNFKDVFGVEKDESTLRFFNQK